MDHVINLASQGRPQTLFCLYLSLFLSIILFNTPKAITQHSSTGSAQAIDAYFSRLEAFGLSGSLLIGNKEEILLKKDYGNRVPADGINLAYLTGSITKQFTATAILLLEQRGLLHTNDNLLKHLPNTPQDKAHITLHQLLTHTSGLKDDYWDQNKELTEKEYITKMLSEPLQAEPGNRFRYANFGYHLLAKVIERVSKKEYERFLTEELFRPNGIQYTGFNLVDWKENQVVEYTDWTTAGSEQYIKNPLDRPVYLQPEGSGGILSTTVDLYKWYQTIFHSSKVLTDASKKKLLTPEKESYGYGWEIYKTSRGTALIEHGGYDSWVGIVTGFYYFAEEDIVVIFLGNTHMSQLLLKEDLMNNIEALLFGGSLRVPPTTNSSDNQMDLEQLFGTYQNNGKSITISKGKLNNQIRLRTTDEQTIRQLLFPSFTQAEKNTDVQLEYIFEHFSNGDYEPLKLFFFNDAPFEAVKNRYIQIWTQLTTAMGPYKGFQVLHTMPNQYEGKFELLIFTELQFENGNFYTRAFRNHHGRIHIQQLDFPRKLEIFLTPVRDGGVIFWNIKTGITSTLKFYQNKLSINDNPKVEFVKG